jgi:hypothetical protein
MAFNSVWQLVDAENQGRMRRYAWRKVPSQATTAGIWFDLALSPWNPIPKFWFDSAPLAAKVVAQSIDGWVYHGANVAPMQKALRMTTAMTTWVWTPMPLILCDYLLYYPTIDDSVTDPQILDNTASLTRYTDWKWVQIMAVTLASRTWGQKFYVTYTNSEWVTGRVSQIVTQNTITSVGSITNSNTNINFSAWPFIGLQLWDTGVRKIESVQMLGGDVWLFALVLVKPIAQTQITGIDAPVEKDYFLETGTCPTIIDDAYLNWICCPQASLSWVPIIWDLQVVWN